MFITNKNVLDNRNMEEEKYKNPVIPNGFRYLRGEWNNGFTIINTRDGSQFVWIPVGRLEADGTTNGLNFNRKFGRRKFENHCRNGEYTFDTFYDSISQEVEEKVKNTGGFYISAYLASVEDGSFDFKENRDAVTYSYEKCERFAQEYALKHGMKDVTSELPSGAAYDCLCKYFMLSIQSKDIIVDSKRWYSHKNGHTGNRLSFYGIYDLGLKGEATSEMNGNYYVVRGEGKAISHRTLQRIRGNARRDRKAFRIVLYVRQSNPFEKEEKLLRKIMTFEKK